MRGSVMLHSNSALSDSLRVAVRPADAVLLRSSAAFGAGAITAPGNRNAWRRRRSTTDTETSTTAATSIPDRLKPSHKANFGGTTASGGAASGTTRRAPIASTSSIIPTQCWVSTGPNADTNTGSVVDVKWDGTFLYILSHPFNASGSFTLHSYTYDTLLDTYTLRGGFPVTPNSGSAEAATLDKDTTGKLWISWEDGRNIMINTSQGDDTSWGTPFVLPVQGDIVATDDICALAAFDSVIGVMWSDQTDEKVYFATHNDGDPDGTWQPREDALGGSGQGALADDHLNFATTSDPGANVYAVTKTSLDTAGAPQILLLHRTAPGTWASYEVGVFEDEHTRPIILIDEENRTIYVFAMSLFGANSIRVKTSDLDNISFSTGPGQMFIQGDDESSINNPTSTKQTLNGQTNLVVLASDGADRVYMHNFLDLAAASGPDIDVIPVSHDYGDVAGGQTSMQTFWVHNSGIDSLHVSGSRPCRPGCIFLHDLASGRRVQLGSGRFTERRRAIPTAVDRLKERNIEHREQRSERESICSTSGRERYIADGSGYRRVSGAPGLGTGLDRQHSSSASHRGAKRWKLEPRHQRDDDYGR